LAQPALTSPWPSGRPPTWHSPRRPQPGRPTALRLGAARTDLSPAVRPHSDLAQPVPSTLSDIYTLRLLPSRHQTMPWHRPSRACPLQPVRQRYGSSRRCTYLLSMPSSLVPRTRLHHRRFAKTEARQSTCNSQQGGIGIMNIGGAFRSSANIHIPYFLPSSTTQEIFNLVYRYPYRYN
jgi:hypothetical protein